MKKLIILLFISFISVGYSQGEATSAPKITIKISLEETITIKNHQVTFVKVLEDSRCPKGVTCIWAGRAKVLVEITEEGKESIQKELIFGQINQGESNDLTIVTTEEKKVVGITLRPYPSTENSGSEKEYQLMVSVVKNEK